MINSSLVVFLFVISVAASAKTAPTSSLALQTIEKSIGGRLGVVAIDVKTGRHIEYRSEERFLMCSTFKLALVGQILRQIDSGKEKMDRAVSFSSADLLEYAPVTSKHVSERQMTIKDLSIATLQYSDSAAANLLLRTQGGPTGLTKFLRSIGDKKTHLDRIEPELNTPKDDLDTTTPMAMAETVRKLVLGEILSSNSREFLQEWLFSNAISNARFRAGVPVGWRVADKGGSGDAGATNDIGVLYRPNGTSIVLTAFASGSTKPRKEIEAALAEVARLVSTEFSDR
ncbi:MAG TPA: class A beta-lactamase [Bdellovibrio sp.]|uniref:class A beta-lactamase n=1 Tax=Bdellovibrio sp. TaxID=28201 RepID=UPI002EEC5EAF